jgi:hypothetical protein
MQHQVHDGKDNCGTGSQNGHGEWAFGTVSKDQGGGDGPRAGQERRELLRRIGYKR